MRKYTYHYSAMYQQESGIIEYLDGIAKMENKILDYRDYQNLKKLIDRDNHEKLIVQSLTLID